jgi:type I restriction enzyme R subunit
MSDGTSVKKPWPYAEVFILDEVFAKLPTPPFTKEEKERVARDVYRHVWQKAVRGDFASAA